MSAMMPIIADELQQFQIFRSLSRQALEALAGGLIEQTLAPNEILFQRGEPGDAMYLVRSGQIAIFLSEPGSADILFRHYGAGQVVGEFALLDGKPRSASARAEGEARTWVLKQSEFQRLLVERPVIGVELMKSLAERIRYTTDYLRKLNRAVDLLIGSDYERALQEMSASASDDEVQGLINAFLEVVSTMRQRESLLGRATARSRVEVDARE